MTCPNCASPTAAEQKFCRVCGAGLQAITHPLPDIARASDLKKTPVTTRAAQQGFMLWAFILMFVGVVIGIVGKKLMHDELVTVVGILVSLLGMFLTVYPYLSPGRSRRSSSGPAEPAASLEAPTPSPAETPSTPAKQLTPDGTSEYTPSVTERTTDLLKVPRSRR